jgi:hypothetical protein
MATYTVALDFSNILTAADFVERTAMRKVSDAVQRAAEDAKYRWADAVMKAPGIWAKEREAYVASIGWRWVDGNHLSAVVETNLPLADEIENGRPARDLKRMLNTSVKARNGKNGRYLIIPFRHNTTGNSAHAPAMPSAIYSLAGGMDKSLIVGHGKRESGTGAFSLKTKQKYLVRQRQYSWGDRLPSGLAPKLKDSHRTDIYAGMTRMNTSSGEQKSSKYLTFRVMSEHSAGWVVPPKPGLHIARDVAQNVDRVLKREIEAG